jgi:cytidine deaminase
MMQERQIQIAYRVYDGPDSLPDRDRALLLEAALAIPGSYAPYSKFHVGAALLMADGRVVQGSNQENASYPLGFCAERTALSAAVSLASGIAIVAIAIKVTSELSTVKEPTAPCGICRQVLLEAETKHGRDIRIILQGETGPVYVFNSVKDLLPLHFDHAYL